MFNTLAYYLGFSGEDVTAAETDAPSFVTKEAEDQWTLVDLNATKSDGSNEITDYPTPPPTPKLERSWLITPPPCFNGEAALPVEDLSPRENLLIEHPSIFVKVASPKKKKTKDPETDKKTVTPQQQQHKKASTNSRSQRQAARQALFAITQQSKRKYQFKKTNWNSTGRHNSAVKKMRQPVHQPRKHC